MTLKTDKALIFKHNKEAIVLVFAQIKTIDSSVHLFLCCLVLYAQIKHCKMFIKCVTFVN